MMIWIQKAGYAMAAASGGNPVIATLTVFLFYIMFSILEAGVEKLIWGERFEHWLDPVFAISFMAMAAYSVWSCAIYNVTNGS